MSKSERTFHCLKHYMFECQCPACLEDWPLEHLIHDEIYRIPTFEQEVIYKVRFGDKKEAVSEIIEARRDVEREMSYNRFKEALLSYQTLCQRLETHLRHPHAYFLQARSGITHCIWNLYCTQFPEKEITEEIDITANREHAKQIYKNDFAEKISTNDGLDLGNEVTVTKPADEVDTNKNALYDETRKMLEQSNKKFSHIKEEQERIEREKQASISVLQPVASNDLELNEGKIPAEDSRQKLETLLKPSAEELEIQERQLEYVKRCREEEQRIKDLKKKQWQDEDNKRREREEQRKLQRAKETQERIRQDKEREAKKRELKKLQEEERLKEKQRQDEERERLENEFRQKQEEIRKKRKLQEEEELEKLLLQVDDLVIEEDPIEEDQESSPSPMEHIKIPTKFEETEASEEKKELLARTNIQFINFRERKVDSSEKEEPKKIQTEEPSNVWSSLRQIKESSSSQYKTIFSSKTEPTDDKVSLNDIDDMIHNLAKQIAEKRLTDLEKRSYNGDDANTGNKETVKPVTIEIQENKNDGAEEEKKDFDTLSDKYSDARVENRIINNASTETLKQPFDYDEWKTHMDQVFCNKSEEPLKKSASDEKYLNSLKEKIKTNIEKNKKNFKDQEIKVPVKPPKQEEVEKPKSSIDEFTQLKLKDKERKRRKQDAIFQQKLEESKSKVVDMSLKSQKLEKISEESEREIRKIKDMAKKLVTRSVTNENEFNEIFTNLDNLENVIRDTGKKSKKSRKKEAAPEKSVHEVEVHWTEEDSNRWTTDKKAEVARVTSLLSALKTAAAHGASSFVSSSIQNTIRNCQQMQEESEEERKREKIELMKKQKEIERVSPISVPEVATCSKVEVDKPTEVIQKTKNEVESKPITEDIKKNEDENELKCKSTVESLGQKMAVNETDKEEDKKLKIEILKSSSPTKDQKIGQRSIEESKSMDNREEEVCGKSEVPKQQIVKQKTAVANDDTLKIGEKEIKNETIETGIEAEGSLSKKEEPKVGQIVKEEFKAKKIREKMNVESESKTEFSASKIKKMNNSPKKDSSLLEQKSPAADKKILNEIKVVKALPEPSSEVNTNKQEQAEAEAEKAKLKRQEDFLAKMKSEEQNKKKLIKEKLGKQLRQIQEDKKIHYENLEKKKRKVETPKQILIKPQETLQKLNKEQEIKAIKSNSKKLTHLINSVETIISKDQLESKQDTKKLTGIKKQTDEVNTAARKDGDQIVKRIHSSTDSEEKIKRMEPKCIEMGKEGVPSHIVKDQSKCKDNFESKQETKNFTGIKKEADEVNTVASEDDQIISNTHSSSDSEDKIKKEEPKCKEENKEEVKLDTRDAESHSPKDQSKSKEQFESKQETKKLTGIKKQTDEVNTAARKDGDQIVSKTHSTDSEERKKEVPRSEVKLLTRTEAGSHALNDQSKCKTKIEGSLPSGVETSPCRAIRAEDSSLPPKIESPSPSKKSWPKEVTTVGAKSFIPQKNQKNEIEFIKIGSPSQVRKAVLSNLDVETDRVTTEEKPGYKICKVPTTNFEVKIPMRKKETPVTNESNKDMEVLSMSKYPESKPTRKESRSCERPPPPSFKPPPPPSFKPPPPPPLF